MRNNHIFSEKYNNRKQTVLAALRRESATESEIKYRSASRMSAKVLAAVAILSALTVGVFAATKLIDFSMERDGDNVRIHAGLNDTGENTVNKEDKPLRSWRAEDGEISVKLNIPDLPADLEADKTASGKYGGEDSSRAITVNGVDLRRSDMDQTIVGATSARQLSAGDKTVYVVQRGEADFYDRIAYIVLEEDELVLKLWISHGITDEELASMASTLTLEYTTDATLAIPIQNELGSGSVIDVPAVNLDEGEPIFEEDLAGLGESVRDVDDSFTVIVDDVSVYDNIGVLDPDCIKRGDFVDRFTDEKGDLITYDRTQVVWIESEGKKPVKVFRESVPVTKKLYVVTLTMADIALDDIPDSDRDRMLKAIVNDFNLSGYNVRDGKIDMISMNAVVDRNPAESASCNEIVYREDLGDGRWRVAYLIDDDIAEKDLVLSNNYGKVYVKIQ